MTTPLLRTKLKIPRPRPELVLRPRLTERLDEGVYRRLTVVSAPAGFGKTTLLALWARESALSAAWLSLDESDNELTLFLVYLIAALQTVEAHIGKTALSILRSPKPPPAEVVLTSLINDIAAIPTRALLVLDDYHMIGAPSIHEALTFLVRHLPPTIHLVIATRVDPPLPLARLRARDQLTELRAADLRFSPSEASEFLKRVMDLDLSEEDIAALEARTEGWVAGLQMAAISVRGHKDATGFIKSFSGSHRFVLDYLIEEVLQQQSEAIQVFLLQTAVLDRLNASLCDAVRFGSDQSANAQDDGRAMLEKLERANLFITHLDDERHWYSYHELFADLLRHRLRQKHPNWVPRLHDRASAWYEEQGLPGEAIDHALRGEVFERATRLVDEHADAMWRRGEHERLRLALAALPEELIVSRPDLCIFQAWYLFASGRKETAERFLAAVELAIQDGAPDGPNAGSDGTGATAPTHLRVQRPGDGRARLRGRSAAIKAFMASYGGDISAMIQHASQALDWLPEQDTAWRCLAGIVLGDAQGFTGNMKAANRARELALRACRAAGHDYYVILAYLKLAITLREQGRLRRTIAMCQQQMEMARSRGLSQGGVVGWAQAILGEVLAERGDAEAGLEQAERGVQLAESGGDLALLGWSYLCLLRVLNVIGDRAAAARAIKKMESRAREYALPTWVTHQAAAWQARLWLAEGNTEGALAWGRDRGLIVGEEAELPQELGFFSLIEAIVVARILIKQRRLAEALNLLRPLLAPAEAGDRTTRVIEILLLQALALEAGADTDQALETLERALAMAEPEGFQGIFVDEGPSLAHLLLEAATRGIKRDYVDALLAQFGDAGNEGLRTAKPSGTSSVVGPSSLLDPLSERELEVLELVAAGLTNREIATRLFLSLNTVKSHTRSIYPKLGAHSRTQAVARARAWGILQS